MFCLALVSLRRDILAPTRQKCSSNPEVPLRRSQEQILEDYWKVMVLPTAKRLCLDIIFLIHVLLFAARTDINELWGSCPSGRGTESSIAKKHPSGPASHDIRGAHRGLVSLSPARGTSTCRVWVRQSGARLRRLVSARTRIAACLLWNPFEIFHTRVHGPLWQMLGGQTHWRSCAFG